jgi:tetratricopeptide (TPR) repeat protein
MKALEKDRNRRYETANGFALDVQRYLADEPVQACPPSAGYRLRKLWQRNKKGLVAAGLFLSLLVLLAGSIGWAVRDQAARQARVTNQADLALEQADRHQDDRNWPEALQAAKRAEAILASGNADALLERRVRQAVADLELVRRLEETRLLRGELLDGMNTDFGRISQLYASAFRVSGIDVEVLSDQEAADRLRARPGITIALAQALDNWADCLYLAGNERGARRLFLLAAAVDPEPWRVKVRQAAADLDLETLSGLARSEEVARQPPASLVLLAEALAQRRNEAVALLERACELHPADFWVHARLAQLAAGLQPKRLDLAIRHYVAARALRPGSMTVWGNLGLCLLHNDQVDEAIACLQKAVELVPDHPGNHHNLGAALDKKGRADEAIAHYRTAIALGPKNDHLSNLYIDLGLSLVDQGKLDEAIASYRKAIEIEPENPKPHTNLGAALVTQKRLDEAITCCRKAIDLDPKYVFAHNILGTALQKQGKVAEAITCYRRAIELDPNFASPHANLGNALYRQGKADEAIACYRRAIELNPRFVMAHNDLRHILFTQGKIDEALAVSRQEVRLTPDNGQAHAILGLLLGQKQAFAEAIRAYREAIRLGPNDTLSINNLAWLLATCPDPKLRDAAEAVKLAKRAVELDPKNPTFPSTLGAAHYRAGDWKAAVAALEKSMTLRDGGDSNEWFFLAMAHWKLGAEDEARQWYSRAVQWMEKNDPKNEELRWIRTETEEVLRIKKQAP